MRVNVALGGGWGVGKANDYSNFSGYIPIESREQLLGKHLIFAFLYIHL